MVPSPNLARRPFVNERPVVRLALLLAVAGLVLLLANLWLYVSYARTRSANASQLREIESRIGEEETAIAVAEKTLAEADIGHQNELVHFLNQRIDERTFGWSVLFDRLAGLLPNDVRLNTLGPRFEVEEERARGRRGVLAAAAEPARRVELDLQGTARDGEAILELINALFADPAFRDPNLAQESQTPRGEVNFSLTVEYLPQVAETPAAPAEATTAGDEADGDDAADDEEETT